MKITWISSFNNSRSSKTGGHTDHTGHPLSIDAKLPKQIGSHCGSGAWPPLTSAHLVEGSAMKLIIESDAVG